MNGFDTDLWTVERVAAVITQLTVVRHHPEHVWVILRHRLGWTLQRPERQAIERDEEAIARWVAQEWPWIKKAPLKSRLDLRGPVLVGQELAVDGVGQPTFESP